jgi:hypothetical protein
LGFPRDQRGELQLQNESMHVLITGKIERPFLPVFAGFCRFLPGLNSSVMDKKLSNRVVVTTKDVQLILGKSPRSARDLLQKVKRVLKKKPRQYVTVAEFCEFVGITEAEVREFL